MLYRHVPRIDCLMNVDWRETHVLLKAAFPLRARSDFATYETAYAVIKRSTLENTPARKAQYEVPAHKWADVSAGDFGTSLLNNCKYGYDIKAMMQDDQAQESQGTMMRISLLRSPTSPDPQADKHEHSFTISLYPHPGDWRKAKTVQRAWELNVPLVARIEPHHKGHLKPVGSFLSVSPENIIVTVVKKAEDSLAGQAGDVILRWYETEGRDTTARIRLSVPVKEAWETDLMEKPLGKVNVRGGTLAVPTGHFEIKSVKVKLGGG
jgi:alpha-mannosidase